VAETTVPDIKPITTIYKGYKFRSRLEARWAVFFDALGLEWDYEKEGFDLGDGLYYLPDFYLPDLAGRKTWIEVKPEIPPPDDIDIKKIAVFQRLIMPEAMIFIAVQDPMATKSRLAAIRQMEDGSIGVVFFYFAAIPDDNDIFMIGATKEEGKEIEARIYSRKGEFDISDHLDLLAFTGAPQLVNARQSARSARFEHGEKG
jgi:hypothetical protein